MMQPMMNAGSPGGMMGGGPPGGMMGGAPPGDGSQIQRNLAQNEVIKRAMQDHLEKTLSTAMDMFPEAGAMGGGATGPVSPFAATGGAGGGVAPPIIGLAQPSPGGP